MSVRVLGDLERGRRANYLDSTLAAIEGSLGWAPGSCERIVAGGRPAREMDPMLSRLLDAWPRLSHDARAMLVELAERALR